MELVSTWSVLARAACPIAITWLATVACGTEQGTHASTRVRSLVATDAPVLTTSDETSDDDTLAAADETDCLGAGAETPQQPGTARWLEALNGPEISGIASDASGRVWVTQSGAQTLLLSPQGELAASWPFGARVALSRVGRAFVAGAFSGSQVLGGHALESRGARDVYVAELSTEGEVLSAFALGGAEDDDVESLNIDALGDLIVSGPGLGTQKVAPDGSLRWQSAFVGPSAVAANGAVWVTGENAGDVQLVQLSDTGALLQQRRFGDEALQQGEAIAVDAAGNVLLAGTFDGSIDFGSGVLRKSSTACSSDAWCATFGFVAELDTDGGALWATSLGPLRRVGGVIADAAGNAVVSAALPGGVRPFRQTWLAAFDTAGRELWQRAEWPATGIGAGRALGIAACGRVIWGLSARPSLELEEQSFVSLIQP